MRIRLALTLDIDRAREDVRDDVRDVQLDSLVERGDPHPEVDRPIGFRRTEVDE